jgi:hypothetical protein
VLLYVLFIYLSYLLSVPFGALYLLYLILIPLSGYTLIGLVVSIDSGAVRQRLTGLVPARTAGGILVALALLFILKDVADIMTALTNELPVDPVWVADFAVGAPAWLVGGLLLWRREALGYVVVPGLLLLGCMLFIGIIFVMVFPVFYSAAPIDVAGIVFMFVAGMICFIPFLLFARGIVRS